MISGEIFGSVTAACASTILGHPLDTVKVHLQTQSHVTTSTQAIRSLLKANGNNPSVFFRGIKFPLLNQIVMNTVMFSVFFRIQSWSNHHGANEYIGSMGAGLVSGFATACLSTPTDYFKIHAQLTENKRTDGVVTTLRRFLKSTPSSPMVTVATLYRGHVANLWREGIFTVVYLSGYDRIRNSLQPKDAHSNEIKRPKYMDIVAVSSLTGAVAWVLSYPFDTMKTIIQSQASIGHNGTTMRGILKERWNTNGGIKSLFRGCGASTGRAILVTSVRMLVYEWSTSILANDVH